MASETLQVGPLGFYSTGDSLSDLLEAETKQQRIQENTSSMASETLHLSPLDFYSSVGYSSSDLVEATATKKPTIRKNTSSVASDTPHLNPPGFSSSIVDSSSEFVEASTVSEITHTNVGRNPSDSWDDEEYLKHRTSHESRPPPLEPSSHRSLDTDRGFFLSPHPNSHHFRFDPLPSKNLYSHCRNLKIQFRFHDSDLVDPHPSLTGRSIVNSTRTSLDLGNSSSPSHSSLTKSISDASSQSLSSILNNPHVGKSGDASWVVGWWSSSSTTSVSPSEFSPVAASPNLPGSDLTRSDFRTYLSSISHSHNRFENITNHTKKEEEEESSSESGLASCLREVPSLYFKEGFALEDGARATFPFSSLSENLSLQEKLSRYLDVVEMRLVKEISVRSDSFFEAHGRLEDLNGKIVEGCGRIRELKETVRVIDRSVVDSARRIQELSSTRVNMLELQRKLRVILYVNQALTALRLLVASADCAGALDITDDLQNLLYVDFLRILTAEFMRISIHNTGEIDVLILSSAKKRGYISSNGETGDEVKLEEEDTSTLCDRLLPLVIGLLRTAKFPSILRMYREALTSEMKNAIKNAVAELLPILVGRSLESDFSHGERSVDVDGGGLSLASKLRTLSSEAFLNCYI
ncbi:hypothetical protein Rs2_13834 [Raphanus sativus]|nr:hypothetical protein Rs2_13834 [Raphanus sativus]